MKHREKVLEADPQIDAYADAQHGFGERVEARCALKEKIDDLIEQGRRAGIEEVIAFIQNGVFLHDQAPPKLFANEVTAEIRKQLL